MAVRHSFSLAELEKTLTKIGAEDGEALLGGLLAKREAPSLGYFIRTLVGLDRQAAQDMFSDYLGDRSLSTSQIRFIELLIDQLTARGVIEPGALYEKPFTDLHGGGPDALFVGKDDVITGIFEQI